VGSAVQGAIFPEPTGISFANRGLLAGPPHDFSVVSGDVLAGVLMKNDLVKAIAEGGRQAHRHGAMRRSCAVVEASELLPAAFDKTRQGECSALPVLQEGRRVGLFTLENFGELVMVSEATSRFEKSP